MSEAQEGHLALKERLLLKIHVMMCSGCHNFDKQMFTLHQVMHAYASGDDARTDKTNKE
jgi:hypothetical protein